MRGTRMEYWGTGSVVVMVVGGRGCGVGEGEVSGVCPGDEVGWAGAGAGVELEEGA